MFYLDLEIVGTAAVVVAVLAMSPFLVMCTLGIPQIDPARWLQRPEDEPPDTIQSYEEGIGLRDEGSSRGLKRSKADKAVVPLQVLECAEKLIMDESPIGVCGDLSGSGTKSSSSSSDTFPYSFDLDSFSLDSSDEAEAQTQLSQICALNAFLLCAYTPSFNSGRRLLEQKSTDVQGTLALFQLSLDGDHSIAVKLGHEFDTTCVDFAETIDHGYFTDEAVDVLKDGEFKLN